MITKTLKKMASEKDEGIAQLYGNIALFYCFIIMKYISKFLLTEYISNINLWPITIYIIFLVKGVGFVVNNDLWCVASIKF